MIHPAMKKALHQRPRSEASLSDEWETPNELVKKFEIDYNLRFQLDVASNGKNSKCLLYIEDSLNQSWATVNQLEFSKMWGDIYCNPPNSLTQKFIKKANEQWILHNLNILMLIPINATVTKNGKKYIWDNPDVEIHPVLPTPKFIHNGVQGESARNRYCVCIWRKKRV